MRQKEHSLTFRAQTEAGAGAVGGGFDMQISHGFGTKENDG